ncbi:MAG: exosortase K [Lentimicrobiaceae bacterium]|nr:exosortase K [Lentimicrobiaceae bacterium]
MNHKKTGYRGNIPYYLAAIAIFVLLKIGYAFADINDLAFLLKPTAKFVGLLTGSQAVYSPDHGYYYENLNIAIEKSCSGFNFWILGFLVFSYLGLKYFDKHLHKILTLPTALIFAYLLTVFSNTSRIFASVIVRNQTITIFPDKQYLIHEIVSIITNLSFLILAYCLIEFLLKRRYHAKFT